MKIESTTMFTGERIEAILVNDTLNVRSILDTELEETKLTSSDVNKLIIELQAIFSSMKQTEKRITVSTPRGVEGGSDVGLPPRSRDSSPQIDTLFA